jgi:CheY-like chemotaxis protein
MSPKISIMIVDDDEQVRSLLGDYLLARGNDVALAPTGDEAIELAKKNRFGLVFLDYEMPGLNGLQTARQLKKIDPDAAVVILSGSLDTEAAEAIERQGIEVLQKPFSLPDIQEIVIREEEKK